MRELKFRAWSKCENMYIYEFSMIDGIVMRKLYPSDNYIVEQYTGKKDINGVEVYEGDIYIDSWGSYKCIEFTTKEVREITGHGKSERFIRIGFDIGYLPDTIKIVGNKNEIPELYKKVI